MSNVLLFCYIAPLYLGTDSPPSGRQQLQGSIRETAKRSNLLSLPFPSPWGMDKPVPDLDVFLSAPCVPVLYRLVGRTLYVLIPLLGQASLPS